MTSHYVCFEFQDEIKKHRQSHVVFLYEPIYFENAKIRICRSLRKLVIAKNMSIRTIGKTYTSGHTPKNF